MCGVRRAVWESHTGAWNLAARFLARRLGAMVVISQGLKDFYRVKGIAAENMLVVHDGVDPLAFAHPREQTCCAGAAWLLPQQAKLAMYIGSLGAGKGVGVLCEAASLVHEARVAVVGGEEKEIALLRARYPRVLFVGARPYRELADNQAAADALVIPNSAQFLTWSTFTSPLKLFAAMMSHAPIVAAAVPSICEVLDDTCAYLVEPDNAPALAVGIQKALDAGGTKAAVASVRVRAYYWDARAKNIIGFIFTRDI